VARSQANRRAPDEPEESVDDCDEHIAWALREWTQIEPDVEAIVTRIGKANRYIERAAVDTLESLDLAQGELKVLLRLSRGRRSHGEIARDLLVSTGTMTNRLDKLEAAGFVSRHADPADRRGVIVELTASGRQVLDRYIGVQAAREQRLLSAMSAEDKRQLNRLLRKLLASVEAGSGVVKR
jgi:DNA-binding MarR family transcriptional regulator